MAGQYDTFWRRVGAGFIDGLVFLPLTWLAEAFQPYEGDGWGTLAWSCALAFGPIVYSVLMHYRYGQTLGKMATGVEVLDLSEERDLTFRQAWLRDIGLIVLQVCATACDLACLLFQFSADAENVVLAVLGFASFLWFLLEVLTMLTNDKRRALHDWIAGCVVVRKS